MNNVVNYRKRNLTLLAATLLVLLASYFFSIRKTIAVFRENAELEMKLEQAGNAPFRVKQLEAEAGKLQQKMRFLTGNDDVREEILEILSKKDGNNEVTLKSMKAPLTFEDGDMLIETYEIVLQGNFISLTKRIHVLEQMMTLGRIAGIKYQIEKDRVNSKENLVTHIYIQTSRKNEAVETI
jgi:hypothetical protein